MMFVIEIKKTQRVDYGGPDLCRDKVHEGHSRRVQRGLSDNWSRKCFLSILLKISFSLWILMVCSLNSDQAFGKEWSGWFDTVESLEKGMLMSS